MSHPEARMLVVPAAPAVRRVRPRWPPCWTWWRSWAWPDRVSFHPPLPHDQVPVAYRAADVLVVPSRSESFGLVAAEAQACGMPVVAARVGGLEHVVADGETGFLIEGWDPGRLRRCDAPDPRRSGSGSRSCRRAVTRSQRFSWSATADRLLELYAGMARPRTGRTPAGSRIVLRAVHNSLWICG